MHPSPPHQVLRPVLLLVLEVVPVVVNLLLDVVEGLSGIEGNQVVYLYHAGLHFHVLVCLTPETFRQLYLYKLSFLFKKIPGLLKMKMLQKIRFSFN